MATLQQSIVAIQVPFADPAAAATEADMPKQWGLPDATDILGLLMPFAGALVGLSVQGAPASGDTVTVTPKVGGSVTAMTGGADVASLATQITHAAPAASTIISKDDTTAQFAAGTFISLRYLTTTGGTYAVNDLLVTLYISTGREDV